MQVTLYIKPDQAITDSNLGFEITELSSVLNSPALYRNIT